MQASACVFNRSCKSRIRWAAWATRMKTVGVTGTKVSTSPERDFERFGLAADIFERLERCDFPSLQPARGEDGHMSGQMRQIGMQFLPEVLHKFPDSIPHIGHQGITGILHVNPKLYPRKRAARVTTDRKQSAIIDTVGA